MRRLFIYSIGLFLLFSVAIIVMILIGRAKLIPDRLAMLHLTDCQIPCWIGITPSKTTISQAKAYIDAVYATAPDYLIVDTQESDDTLLQFLIHTKSSSDGVAFIRVSASHNGVIAWIDITFFDLKGQPLGIPPTIAELHSILGPPASTVIAMTPEQTKLLYRSTTEGLIINPQKYGQWNAQVYALHLFGTLQNYTFETCPWDGFAKRRELFGENSVIELGC
jgi:hypothetical protein